ncbi:MAG: hypothetical protein JSU68_04110 [Phycisphaerales bacterium]|nr:MAG: hypothetical protein JSU68_04110 [Phycisphaerales bacterium]
MTYEELIAIADARYPDGLVRDYFENPDENHGDPLARYIVNALEGLAGTGNDDAEELREAVERLERAVVDLAAMASGLRDEASRRELARLKSHKKARAKKSGQAAAPATDPVNFKRGDYVRPTGWRATRIGRVMFVEWTLNFVGPDLKPTTYCVEWADRSRSLEIPALFDWPPLEAATEAQFTEARREFDRLAAALQPGVKFVMHDEVTQGMLEVLQAPMKGVLAHGAAWIGGHFLSLGDTSTSNPHQTPSPPDHAFFVVAREIDSNKLRAVRVEPGVVETTPSALVAGPFRRGRDPDSTDGRGPAEDQETGPSSCSIPGS